VGNRVLKEAGGLPAPSAEPESVTEEAITRSISVDEVMEPDIIAVRETDKLTSVFRLFTESHFITCPIVDTHGVLVGVVRLEDLRPLLLSHHALEWLIAGDVCFSPEAVPQPGSSLANALDMMAKDRLREIPVVEPKTHRVVGLLNHETAERYIQEKWLAMNSHIALTK
jgi:CBS domain-containing protein